MQKQGGSYEADKKGKSKLINRTQDADNGDKLEKLAAKEENHDSNK